MPFIDRHEDARNLKEALSQAPVTLLTGPRQAGKSTLARQTIPSSPAAFFDLEDHRDLARLTEPTLALRDIGETVVIDEAQRMPDLFPTLRVLVDEGRRPGRFVVLGSASPDLVGLGSETLAGRIAFVELGGFRLTDVGTDHLDELWLRGGLPESFLASSGQASNRWLDDYISTFLERDLADLGFRFPATTMRRFWTMLAHFHGQTLNSARIARSIDVSESTVRRYIDALTDALVVRQLPPWFANISKRQVKSPRVYIRDSGLLHRLLGLDTMLDLERSPTLGASWEGWILEQMLTRFASADPTFWSTHGGAEVDLRLEIDGRVLGFEIKRTARPKASKSIHSALADLQLEHLFLVHAGPHSFPLSDRITAITATDLLTNDDALDGVSHGAITRETPSDSTMDRHSGG